MIGYAARAVPWRPLLTCLALLWLVMELLRRWSLELWPLQGTAVGLVGAAAAMCLDEPAAAIVDAAPRSIAWRTMARCIGVGLVTGAWLTGVAWAEAALMGHPWDVALQGISMIVTALAAGTLARAAGHRHPGRALGGPLVVALTAVAVIRPVEHRLPIFPYVHDADWAHSRWGWAVLGLTALVALGLTLAEARWWRRPGTRTGHTGDLTAA